MRPSWAGPFLAPPTAKAIRRRNRIYRALPFRPLAGLFNLLTTRSATGIKLADHAR